MLLRPSHINLSGSFPPLCGTLDRSELEAAASIIVHVCEVRGDAFGPVSPKDIGEVLGADVEQKREPFASLSFNPFWKPDFRGLVDMGFARWTTGEQNAPIELTELGLSRIAARCGKPATEHGEERGK